jgi:DNA-binding transcriptional ArsR family regulator
MTESTVVSGALAELLGVLGHPSRVRIVEELRTGERDVNSLQSALGISQSGVSQHLSVLRAHRVVGERRAGRRVYYRLRSPELARWLLDGTVFLTERAQEAEDVRNALQSARADWAMAETETN